MRASFTFHPPTFSNSLVTALAQVITELKNGMNVDMLMSHVKVPMGRKSSVILSADILPNIDGRVTGEQ
jgi:hypothetical protein